MSNKRSIAINTVPSDKIEFINHLLNEVTQHKNMKLDIANQKNGLITIKLLPDITGPFNKGLVKWIYLHRLLRGIFLSKYQEDENDYPSYPELKFEIKPLKNESEQYYLTISGLPQELLCSNDRHSLLNCLLRYQNYQNSNNEKDLDSNCSFIGSSTRSGKKIARDLITHNIINETTKWEPKSSGYMPGLIFTSSSGKKTYVKKLSKTECLDFASFAIAKSCGVRTPNVSLVMTDENCYQFSEDVNELGSTKKYQYHDLFDYKTNEDSYFDRKNFQLFRGRCENGRFKECYPIQKQNIARLILATAIFGWKDLRSCNVGIVISEKPSGPQTKLVVIDFLVGSIARNGRYLAEPLRHDDKPLINYLLDQKVISENKLLKELAVKITVPEYIEAFRKIAGRFVNAHAAVKTEVENVFMKLSNKISSDELTELKKPIIRHGCIILKH